jgi:HEAT repeat protein
MTIKHSIVVAIVAGWLASCVPGCGSREPVAAEASPEGSKRTSAAPTATDGKSGAAESSANAEQAKGAPPRSEGKGAPAGGDGKAPAVDPAASAQPASPPNPQPAAQPQVEVDVPELASGLASDVRSEAFAAAERFRQLPPEVRRQVLADLSAYESENVRHSAWRAFATWATRDDVPTLIAALQSPHDDVRFAALELLARFPNDETIGVLTQGLENPELRKRAALLLERVGPAAEGAILNYASHADDGLRDAAWNILAKIGTRKSLLALEQLATQEEFRQDSELKGVLEEIRQRLRQ